MEVKLFDSELKVMDILWEKGEMKAKDIADILKKEVDWKKSTTYTVIKKCLEKDAIERIDPHFICKPLISKSDVQTYETNELIDKIYGGATDQLIANLINHNHLSKEEVAHLRKLVRELE